MYRNESENIRAVDGIQPDRIAQLSSQHLNFFFISPPHFARQFLLIKALFFPSPAGMLVFFFIECGVTFFKSKGGSLNPTSFF